MTKIKLDTADKLTRFLSLIAEESVTTVLPQPVQGEEIRQAQLAKELKPFKAPPDSKKNKDKDGDEEPDMLKQEEEDEEAAEKAPVAIAGEEIPEVTVRKVIDRLNTLRSGRSLKDKDTLTQFTEYFNKLDGGEKQALFAFLDGISNILAAGEDAAPATDPADWGVQVKPALQKSEKPKVKKTGDNPIIVGEAADKTAVIKRMFELRG